MWNQILKTETVTKQMLPSLLHCVNSTSWQHLCLHFSVLFPEEVPEAQPSWLVQIYVATNRGYMYLFWHCHQAFAVVPLIVMTLQKEKRRSSQLVVMNVSQSAWNFCLTSQPAQFLLCCMLQQQYTLSDGCQWQSSISAFAVFFLIDQVKWLSNPSYSEV